MGIPGPPVGVEGGGHIHVRVMVLSLEGQHACAVSVVQGILHPLHLQGVKVDAHEVAAVVGDYQVAPPDHGAVLHAEPEAVSCGYAVRVVLCALIAPLCHLRAYGDSPCGFVVICVELYKVQYSAFAGVYKGIRLGVHKGRAVKVGKSPYSEGVLLAELIKHRAVYEAYYEGVGGILALGRAVVAGADIHEGIAPRIQRARALEGEGGAYVVACLLPRFDVKEVYVAAHGGVYGLHKAVLLLGPVAHVHYALGGFRPANEQRLTRPAAA